MGKSANGVHVVNMCAGFAAAGASVTLCAWRDADAEEGGDVHGWYGVARNFSVDWLAGRKGWLSAALAGWRKAGRRGSWDLVFGRNLFACWAAARRGHPVMFETHLPFDRESPLRRLLLRDLLRWRNVLGLVVISEPIRASYIAAGAATARRIVLCPDAASDPETGAAPRNKKSRTGFVAGYVGHLYPGRGIDVIEGLARRLPNVAFHIVGGDEKSVAEARARNAGLTNLVFHGFVAPRETAAFRSSCDVLLAPYQRQVFLSGERETSAWMSPLKVFEYMASGKPIVCSDLPVLHEVLHHEGNCLFCPPDDIDAWVAALARLKADGALRDRLAEGARRDFEENYTWVGRARRIAAHAEACKDGRHGLA